MVIVIHIQHIIFSDKCLNYEKNKRNKKSGARGIRTPDFGHEETKSACVATRASYSFVKETRLSLKIKRTSLRDLKNGATLHLRLQPQAPSIQISELSQLSTICNDVNMKLALNSLTILNM